MIRLFLFLMGIFLTLCFQGVEAQTPPLEDLMKGIRERYPKGKLLRAEYVRVTATKIGSLVGSEQEEKASGLLFFKAPHQLRLEQDLPEKELLISDGERIYWYLLSKAEVHVYDLEGNTSLVKTISDIFQGMEEGSRIFNPEVAQTEEGFKIRLIPKEPREEFVELDVSLGRDYRITSIGVKNLAGGITFFRFPKQELLSDTAEGLFIFKVPEGVKVIYEGAPSR